MNSTDGPDVDALGRTATVASGESPALMSQVGESLHRGAALGKYIVVDELGSGAMGIVYSAFDPDLDRKVALKVLRKSRDPAARSRLLREAQSMAKLSHPNVVTVFEVATDGGRDFVAMEYVDGQNLYDWQKEDHDVADILKVYRQAGEGLAAAHRAGLVHRDFKPHNVLIDKEGRVRVTDFGIAQQMSEPVLIDPDADTPDPEAEPTPPPPGEHLTRTGAIMGTPAYMAPEQHLAQPTDARTDQFSFSVALFEALAGKRPYKADSYVDLKVQVTTGPVPQLPEAVALPGKLRTALATGMARDREKRHGSLDDLLPFLELPASRGHTMLFMGLIAASLVAVFVFGMNASDDRSACKEDRSRLDGVWDKGVEKKISDAFASTQVDGSDAVFAKFKSIADSYGDELVAMRLDICKAERGPRAESSDELILKRRTCLLGRRQKFLHLTTSFSNTNRSGVNQIVESASELPAVDDCADPDALGSEVKLPPSEQRDEVRALQVTLSEASSQAEAGHVKDALQKALTVRDRARELDYKPLLAEVYVELGDLYRREAKVKDAEDAFEESILAAEESGYSEVRARGLVGLTKLLASRSSRFDEARRNARRAKAAVEQWGDSPLLSVEIERALAEVLTEEGKVKEALELLVLALERYRSHKDAKPVRIAMLQNNIATLLIEQGRYDEAHDMGRDAYDTVRAELADANPKIYTCLATLTQALRMRGDYDEARRLDKISRGFWEGSSGQALLKDSDIYVEASRSVRGAVHDASGAPVTGATVVCGETVITDGRYLDTSWSAELDALLRKRVTQSKKDGSFHCEQTSAKDVVVIAEHQDHGRSEMVKVGASDAAEIELVLRPTGSLSGMVTKDGKAAKPQAVQVLPAANMVASPPYAILTFLRADGSYLLERLAPGKYIVFTGRRSMDHKSALQSQEVEILSNQGATLNFDQSGGDAVLEVTVLGKGGAPMPSAQVMLARGHLESANAVDFNKAVLATGLNFRSHFVEGGKMFKMETVEPGLHSVCVAPIGGDYRDPEHMENFSQETMDRIMIYCQDVVVPAGETTVVKAVVPAWKRPITIDKKATEGE